MTFTEIALNLCRTPVLQTNDPETLTAQALWTLLNMSMEKSADHGQAIKRMANHMALLTEYRELIRRITKYRNTFFTGRSAKSDSDFEGIWFKMKERYESSDA
jgi:hypothetical protein